MCQVNTDPMRSRQGYLQVVGKYITRYNSCSNNHLAEWISLRDCIQKFPDRIDNEIDAYNNKHPFRSNTKGYGGKTHYTNSQNSDTTAPSGRELYHLQLSLHAASPKTFGCTLVILYFPGEFRTLI
jgi:hypothetical protein